MDQRASEGETSPFVTALDCDKFTANLFDFVLWSIIQFTLPTSALGSRRLLLARWRWSKSQAFGRRSLSSPQSGVPEGRRKSERAAQLRAARVGNKPIP
jgi:hypothetical protein